MNANDNVERETMAGDREKRKMAGNHELPSNPRKRIKVWRIVLFIWGCSNCWSYRNLFQVRGHSRPTGPPLWRRRAAPVP